MELLIYFLWRVSLTDLELYILDSREFRLATHSILSLAMLDLLAEVNSVWP
jgi:hypothetical protein